MRSEYDKKDWTSAAILRSSIPLEIKTQNARYVESP
jgi:hypothetical protein